MRIDTSAVLRGGRLLVPEKITSSISDARMDLNEVSPITQRSASTRLDLPQPFGPTTPVRPGSIRKSVGSTKDLKPSRRRRVSFMRPLFRTKSEGRGCPPGGNRGRIPSGLGPGWWLERGAASGRENESNALIPQQKFARAKRDPGKALSVFLAKPWAGKTLMRPGDAAGFASPSPRTNRRRAGACR